MIRYLHPTQRVLQRIADRDIVPGRITRAHLARCQQCRNVIAFSRSLDDDVVRIRGPIAGEELRQAIHARLSGNDHVLLPTDVGGGLSSSVGRRTALAATLVAAMGLWLLSTRGAVASASSGELRFHPRRLSAGSVVSVEYRDAGQFADENVLVLRGRLRIPTNESYNFALTQARLTSLTRTGRGVFRGSFRVPDSVVYGAFAVENEAGDRVDSRNRELWELYATDSLDRPTFEALSQAFNDLLDVNPERALQVVRARARLYPDDPRAWGDLVPWERIMMGDDYADSVRPLYRPTASRLHELYSARDRVSIEVADGMAALARDVSDSAHPELRGIASYWRARLHADTAKQSVTAGRYRLFAAQDSVRKYPAQTQARYEQLWQRGDSIVDFAANNGFQFARMSNDSAAVVRWADRLARRNPGQSGSWVYGRLAEDSTYREVGLDRLRALLRWFAQRDDAWRPLHATRIEHARDDSAIVASVFTSIGKALHASGRTAAALDTLERATHGTWNATVFRQVADLRLSAGDSVGAVRAYASVAADPATSRETSDSLWRRLNVSADRWRQLIQEANAEMRRRVLVGAITRPLSGAPRLATRNGATATLDQLRGGRVTVVTFWSRYCAPSRTQFAELPALARQLNRFGIQLVALTGETPSRSLDEFIRSSDVDFPVYYDRWKEAVRMFETMRTPDYFVLDGSGLLRFANTSLAKVLTQAVALTPHMTAAAPASAGR